MHVDFYATLRGGVGGDTWDLANVLIEVHTGLKLEHAVRRPGVRRPHRFTAKSKRYRLPVVR